MLGQELAKVFSEKSADSSSQPSLRPSDTSSLTQGEGDSGYEVHAWDREDLDLSDEQEVRAKVTELWPDIIINASAYNAVDACEDLDEEYEKARMINSLAPGVLSDIANDFRSTIVHFSTDYVFDGKRPRYRGEGRAPGCCGSGCRGCSYFGSLNFDGYREHDLPQPLSRYGETKYAGEMAVEKGTDQHYIIRLSKLFGAPAQAEGAKRSFFDVMLERGREEKEVSAVHDENSAFTYAPDLAKETRALIEEGALFGVYHLTNSGSATWYEATRKLYDLAGFATTVRPVPASEFPRPAQRPAQSYLVNTKREAVRGWEEALKEYLKSIQGTIDPGHSRMTGQNSGK